MVFRIVGHDHDPSSRSGTGRPKLDEKLPAGDGVEFIHLAPKEEFPVPQADGTEIPGTPPGGMMKQHGILALGRDPHPATPTMLLKVDFVHSPKIDGGISA